MVAEDGNRFDEPRGADEEQDQNLRGKRGGDVVPGIVARGDLGTEMGQGVFKIDV